MVNGVLVIHPNNNDMVNFDIFIRKGLRTRLFHRNVFKKIEQRCYHNPECHYVRWFLAGNENYIYAGSDDLDHVTPEIDLLTVNLIDSLKLRVIVCHRGI